MSQSPDARPPGAGKSLLACLFPTVLPHVTLPKLSTLPASTTSPASPATARPSSPHAPYHPISDVGLIEGGQVPMPAEVFRTHRDRRFLYERLEFKCSPLDTLRQPLKNSALSRDRHLG
ncbi:MAG TPA: ATP-binding protein [Candidatus Tectomicrobia bacterium]|nr:ATP-binding protein [Candidatus Tectomicrobia bacterium]